MKLYLLFAIFVLCFPVRLFAQEYLPAENVKFNERVFNFEEVQEKDGKVSHDFVFKNTGTEPVVIRKVVSECNCTSFSYDDKPVLSGQKRTITVIYNPAYRPGFFSKEIRIFTNNNQIHRIWIKGTVIAYQHPVEEDYPYDFGSGLHLNLKVLSFGRIKGGSEKTIMVKYANDTPDEMKLDFIPENKQTNLLFTKPNALPPNGRAKLLFTYRMPVSTKGGQYNETLQVIVNGKKLQKAIQAKATGVLIQQ